MIAGLIIAAALLAALFAQHRQLLKARHALRIERRYADAERHKHIQVENAGRQRLQRAEAQALAFQHAHTQQAEISRLAIDAAESLVHLNSRLKAALHDAALLIEGRPSEWRRVAPNYRVDSHAADIVSELRPALVADWRLLIDEAQAEIEHHEARTTEPADATECPGRAHLQMVVNNPPPPPAHRPLNRSANDVLDTIGPGIGA